MPATMNSELLRTCVAAYEDAIARLDKLVDGLSDGQANFKPGPKRWSIAQCIQHLNISGARYLDLMEPRIKAAREAGKTGDEPYGRGTLVGRFILGNLRQGAGAPRVPAPGSFKPASTELAIARVAEDFREANRRMIAAAEEADGLALGQVRFGTPMMSLMRVSLAQAFEMAALHEPRHLAQAERVKQAEGFPAQEKPWKSGS
jgi:hypothetical protein